MPKVRHRSARCCALLPTLSRYAPFHLPVPPTRAAPRRHVRSMRGRFHEVHRGGRGREKRPGGCGSRPEGAAFNPAEKCLAPSVQYGYSPAPAAAQSFQARLNPTKRLWSFRKLSPVEMFVEISSISLTLSANRRGGG